MYEKQSVFFQRFAKIEMLDDLKKDCTTLQFDCRCSSRQCLINAGYRPESPGTPAEQGIKTGTCLKKQMYEFMTGKEFQHKE